MNRKLVSAALVTALAVSGVVTGGLSAKASTSTKTYLIAFKQDLPADYQSVVTNAGGKVVRALTKLGGLEVQSDNPSFLSNIRGNSSVQIANVESKHVLAMHEESPAAADGQPVKDIPQADKVNNYWDYQWDIKEVTNQGKSYAIETGGKKNADGTVTHKAIVGVIDTGIDANHPDLKANYLGGKNFVPAGGDVAETGDVNDVKDREGHGTHVTGSIAANGKVQGVGPDLGIRSYRVFGSSGSAPTSWIVDAMVAAADDNVDVINMSIGGYDALEWTYNGQKGSDLADVVLWARATQYAIKKNVTVVAAAGNESLNLDDSKMVLDYMNAAYGYTGYTYTGKPVETPGQIPGVITVSSSNRWSTDKLAFYSNYGLKTIAVAAPGGDNGPVYDQTKNLNQRDFHYRALSTWPTYLPSYFTSNLTSYALLHGTSMASPKVAGIAGVIKAAHPEYKPEKVAEVIKETAIDFGPKGRDELFGAGEANIYNALVENKQNNENK